MKYILGFFLSLAIVLVVMPKLIKFLQKISFQQVAGDFMLEEFKKVGTPTMGGTLFVVVTILVFIILNPTFFKSIHVVLVLMVFLTYAFIGFIDDYIIVVKHDNDGLLPQYKFGLQLLLSIIFYFIYKKYCVTTVSIPFTSIEIDLKWFYAILVFFMFTGSSNAVNLTDGMDGLAAGVTFISLIPFILYCFKANHDDIALLLVCLEGSLIGYLYYNRHPAKIFMGDAGSLALGALLAAVALVCKREFALVVVGGVFVFETICVIIQQVAVRAFHKKVFVYTPIHYAFTIKGWKETKTVYFFYFLATICCVLGLLIGIN